MLAEGMRAWQVFAFARTVHAVRFRAYSVVGRGPAFIALLLACVLTPAAGPAQAPSPGIFSTLRTDPVPDIGVALEPATMRSRVVGVDTQRITAARLGQETLRLNLFEDTAVAVQIDRVRPTRSGYFIAGRPEGFEWGEVRLVVNGAVMVGTVVSPEGKYRIRYAGSGRHVIRQVDPAAERPLHDDAVSPFPSGPPQAIAPGGPLASTVRPATDSELDQPTEDGSEVRVLIVYTPALQAQQGGAAGMQALIDLMIQSTNQAFETSGINPRLVLAHAALVNYVEGGIAVDNSRLHSPDDGYMDDVHTLRNEHAADLIHLLTRYVSGAGGAGAMIPAETLEYENLVAFAVTATATEEVFVHETGHNFGVLHDRFVDLNGSSIYPYAYGYVNGRAFEADAPATARWRTVMAYPNRCSAAGFSCPDLLRFANPDQTWLGDSLGVAADDPETGINGPADARLTINRTARWVGSYRSEACTQFKVAPTTPVVSVDGSEIVFAVETGYGCLWDASSQSGFLAPTTEARQAGSGFSSVIVEPNETGEERIGTITVAGTSIEVRQLATEAGICGRTHAVVQAIAGNRACDEVTDQDLSQVTTMQMGNRGLGVLKAGDFEGLSNLATLHLNANRFSELPEDLFAGLSNLQYLSLIGNQLTELPAGAFADLSQLSYLGLSNNELSELPDDTFSGLSELRSLLLTQNRLSGLSSGSFAGLSELRELHLGFNPYETLPEEVFADLAKLERLYLYETQLTTLPDGVFADLSNLVTLELQANRLIELPQDVFGGLSRLQSLFVSNNELATLPEDAFADLTSLRFLILGQNRLSSLPNRVFSGLTSLEELDLSGNQVDPLPVELNLEKVGDSQFKAVAPTGAPFTLAIPVSSDGGTIEGDAGAITIPAGATESTPLSVTRVTGSRQRVTVDIGMPPELPNAHLGYVFEKDEALPISVLPSIDPADATLSGLWLGQESLDPAFSTNTTRYKASVAHAASSATVTLATSHASATVAFRDENDDSLPDADADADGHQVNLSQAETVINVEVTAANGTSTRTYTIVVTREGDHCDRSGEVLTAILASVPDVDACGNLRNEHLATIARLDLRRQGISSLQSGDFAALSGLRTLRLEANQLTELPADAFSGLSSLEILRLSSNQLTELPAGVFVGLTSLELLILEGNQIESLPDSVFSGLSALRGLSLRDNRLSRLPDGIFSGLTGLATLYLSDNRIGSLPANVFSDLSALTRLEIETNELTSLPADVFSGLTVLRNLWLGSNRLTNLPPRVFSDLSSLRHLTLYRNELTGLPADAFSGLSELETLQLEVNALSSLPADVFSELSALQYLNLNANRLTALPDGLFAGLRNLRRLLVEDNAVDPLPISVSLESVAGGRFKAVVPAGAPFELELPLTVGGGGRIEGDANTVTVPTGSVESAPLSMTRIDEDAETATVDISSLPALPTVPERHEGYVLAKDATLPLEIALPEEFAPPAQVTGVEVERGATSLRMSWTAVADADGYKLQWKSGDEDYDDETRQAVITGGDTLSYAIAGLAAGTEYTVRVLATRSGADDGPFSAEFVAATRSGDPDVNGDGALDGDDAQIMYYAWRFSSLVGDGETGGTEASRQRYLAGYSGLDDPTDEDLRGMVARANAWRTEGLNEGGDINADGVIDDLDARAMYRAYTYESLLGDGVEGGSARFRSLLLGRFAGKADPTDEDLKAMLRRANELREAYSQ